MSIAKGDHLVIKRGDHIVGPEDGESYHEFEVLETPEPSTIALRDVKAGETISPGDYQHVFKSGYIVKLNVVL